MVSRFEHKPSLLYKDAVEALNNLKLSDQDINRGIDQAGRAYSESVHDDLMLSYMRRYSLKLSRVNHRCLCYLVGNKKCSERNPGYYSTNTCILLDEVSDHTHMLIRKGKPFVYITQPYDLTTVGMKSLVGVSERYNLDISVSTESWHFPSGTMFIEIHRNGWREVLKEEQNQK